MGSTTPPSSPSPDDPLEFAARPPPAPPPVEIPERLGPYLIEEQIAVGGMARVLRARHFETGQPVALKVIQVVADDPETRETVARLTREARASRQAADHPNIVGVIDVDVAHGFCYLAMDFVDGPSLDQRLEVGPMAPAEAARVFARVARAVAHAHAQGFVHRDLKPGNIVLDTQGVPFVVDFGMTRSHDGGPRLRSLTQSGTVLGTPTYMPPEQARAGHVDARADIYAIGATLYHCLSGREPFRGRSVFDLVEQVLLHEPRPLDEVSELPPSLVYIVEKAMAKPRSQRYQTGEALAEDLERFLDDLPVAARHGRLRRRLFSYALRRPVQSVLAIGVPLLLLATALAWMVVWPADGRDTTRAATTETGLGADRMRDLQEAYRALMVGSASAMQQLEDLWHGARLGVEERDHALAQISDATNRVASRTADAGSPRAWLGLARMFAGDTSEGLCMLAAARESHPHDPHTHLLAARAHFARFAAAMPVPRNLARSAAPTPPQEAWPAAARVAFTTARTALAAGLAQPLSQPSGLEGYRVLDAAAGEFAKHRFAQATDLLRPLVDDPELGALAQLLLATAIAAQDEFADAARAFERLGTRDWARAMRHALIYWAAAAQRDGRLAETTDAALALPSVVAAQAALDRVHAAWPDAWWAFSERARFLGIQVGFAHLSNRPTEPLIRRAITDLDRALELNPSAIEAYRLRAFAHQQLADRLQLTGQDTRPLLEAALRDAESVVAARGAVASAFATRGQVQLALARRSTGDLAEGLARAGRAVADLERAVELPDGRRFDRLLARALACRGTLRSDRDSGKARDLAGAITRFTAAIVDTPRDLALLDQRAIVAVEDARLAWLQQRDPAPSIAMALEDTATVLQHRPRDAGAWVARGRALQIDSYLVQRARLDPLPRLRESNESFGRALKVAPDHVNALLGRGRSVLQQARVLRQRRSDLPDLGPGIVALDRLLELRPRRWMAFAMRAELHYLRFGIVADRPDEAATELQAALEDAQRACDLNPRVAEPRRLLVLCLELQGRWAELIPHVQRLLQLAPTDEKLVSLLATAHRNTGREPR